MANNIPLYQDQPFNDLVPVGDAEVIQDKDSYRPLVGQSIHLIRLVQTIKYLQSLSIINVPFENGIIQAISHSIDNYPNGLFATGRSDPMLLQGIEALLNSSLPHTYFDALIRAEPQLERFFVESEIGICPYRKGECDSLIHNQSFDTSFRAQIVHCQFHSNNIPFNIQLTIREGTRAGFELLAFIDETGALHVFEDVTTSYVVIKIYGCANEAETLILDLGCDEEGRPTLTFSGVGEAFYGYRPTGPRKTKSAAKG